MILRSPNIAHGRGRPTPPNGYPPFGVSKLGAFLGDSLTEQQFASQPLQTMLGLIGAPLDLIANSGFSGQSVFGLIGQIPNDYRLATAPGLAGLPRLGWVMVRIGTNTVKGADGSAGVTLDASNMAHYVTITNMLLADYADHVIWLPIPPIGGSPVGSPTVSKRTTIPTWNAYIQSLCNGVNVHWVDDCAPLKDGTGAVVPESFLSDQIHMIDKGIFEMAVAGAPQLDLLFSNQGYGRAPLVTSAADVYPATNQWNTNPTNAGTSGTFGAGWSGTLPTGYKVENNGSGTQTGTAEIVPSADSNPVPWIRLTCLQASGSAAIALSVDGAGRTVTSSDPAELEQLIEVRLNGAKNFKRFDAWIQANTRFVKTEYLRWDPVGSTGTVVLRQRYYRIDAASAGSTTKLYLYIINAAALIGDMGSIDIRCWSVRG